jgi:hypothetical protein
LASFNDSNDVYRAIDTARAIVREGAKMDSTRVHVLRGQDTTRVKVIIADTANALRTDLVRKDALDDSITANSAAIELGTVINIAGVNATEDTVIRLSTGYGIDLTTRTIEADTAQLVTNTMRGADTTRVKAYADGIVGPKMDSTRVNVLRGSDTTRTIVREGAKMDSARVHVLRGTDTTRAIVREGLYTTLVQRGTDTTRVKAYADGIVGPKMDSTRVNVLRGSDTTRAIVRENAKIGRGDTLALFVFGGGGGNATDTSAFTTSTYYGSFYNSGRDSIKVTSLRVVLGHGIGVDTLQVAVAWDDSLGGTGAVSLNTAALPVNSIGVGTDDTAFDNAVIPPGVWVWCKTPVVVAGRKPTYMSATLSGYRTRP